MYAPRSKDRKLEERSLLREDRSNEAEIYWVQRLHEGAPPRYIALVVHPLIPPFERVARYNVYLCVRAYVRACLRTGGSVGRSSFNKTILERICFAARANGTLFISRIDANHCLILLDRDEPGTRTYPRPLPVCSIWNNVTIIQRDAERKQTY